MKSAIYTEGNKFEETIFELEEDLELKIVENSKLLFGKKTIYFDIKNKIDTKSLGATIPDGFLFDFRDKEAPEFYLVENELAKHDFYKHIFPQITKFFAFFKNPKSRDNLIEKLFSFIKSNAKIEEEFKKYLGNKEIYRTLKEIIENSQNILIVIDENKPEFDEVMETYTDTWDKMVRIEIFKEYKAGNKSIFTLNPDFEDIGFIEPSYKDEVEEKYTESFHLDGTEEKVKRIYQKIKEEMLKINSSLIFNPQKYYISIRDKKNFAYFHIKRKKVKITLMLPYEKGVEKIKNHRLRKYTEGIERFYGGNSFEITIEEEKNLSEVIDLILESYQKQKD
ncbi:hypothetical protein COU57_06145 [Candidatus Pacearchaeota archaeon CG10_big_fil_rev_8_21_14_0_10_32_14]|nr:MAG: hypothetical protein COU57_06145 [Candidatus Pacearchaeota archaeon CG10_big_fil_rev_8_21_14_0_10_32_14]